MKRNILLWLAVVLFVLAARQQPLARAEGTEPLLVIVAKASGMTDISLAMLRRAFSGELATYQDKRLVPLNCPPRTLERELFDRKVLGLEAADVGRFWITRRIRDEGMPPRTLPSPELGIRVVASYPGAIAYVRANLLAQSPVRTSVRALTIDGKSPTEPGYLLATP